MGILSVSKGTSGRTIEHSGTTSLPSRSPAAPDDMDHVQLAIGRIGTRLEELAESPGPHHDGLKRKIIRN